MRQHSLALRVVSVVAFALVWLAGPPATAYAGHEVVAAPTAPSGPSEGQVGLGIGLLLCAAGAAALRWPTRKG